MQDKANDTWKILTRENLLVRKRENISKQIQKKFSVRVGISFIYKHEESFIDLANNFEDELVTLIDKNEKGLLAAVLTGKNHKDINFREYVFYIDSNLVPPKTFQDVFAKYKTLNATMYGEKDSRWKLYKSLK